MQLLVLRHAIAEPLGGSVVTDASRRLTADGQRRMRRAARALGKLVPDLGCIGSSPLVRAAETAEILAGAYPSVEVLETRCLAPGSSLPELAGWIETHRHSALAVVGHEPDLSLAIAWLAAGSARSCIELEKGGAALLEVSHPVEPGSGTLQWLLRPAQLRRLA